MIITIARQCGCEGDEVGRKLSEIYGIPCYSKKELIEPVSYTHLTLPTNSLV